MISRRILSPKVVQLLKYFFFITLQCCTVHVFSQGTSTQTQDKVEKLDRPAYLNIAMGLNISSFRDFATSPLTYTGNPIHTALTHVDMDDSRESHFTPSYSFGTYKSNYNQHSSESEVKTVSINYLELYQIRKLSSPMFNFKIGGQFNATANHRENSELFNNSEGVDVIATLFGSAKATLGLRCGEEKNGKPKQTLSYSIHVGLVNSSYRNGFAYISPSAPLNNDEFFAGYEFRIFKGFRMNSRLDYTFFLRNRNAIQLGYSWDAYRTGGHHDNFEMATHSLQFSLLFNLK